MHIKFLSENLKRRDDAEKLGVNGRIILEWIYGNKDGKCELDSSASGYGPVDGSCEHGNRPSSSIKGGAFLD
jgi:hypothetical protein